ncbi:phosphodiester glycosidase family protein [Paenibacillus sp. PR3]|uniref:Phosphodiester glycosidase family protein n=2 Tax=Paenibacillus terricola TaxID=2763503 RepID=A0ABR8MQU1_9BACL|nr:phosphodiester glycosidase family protein [Paenibacillus terricola]
MHALVTEPSKVTLEAVRGNVANSIYYGVNGGFFFNGMLLSIAVINDQPVGGKPETYGSGNSNVKFARGTLVWDGAANQLSVQVVSNAADLKVTDRNHYWAQGGISMRPTDESGWRQQVDAEQAPYPDDNRLRTAAVYDKDGKLYLIVSQTKTTLAIFRKAILEAYGEMEDGIFLDGDGSSQLRAFEATLPGDGRQVEQMIRLKNPGETR